MQLRELVESEIRREAEKLALRYRNYHNALFLAHERDKGRWLAPPPRVVRTPPYWTQSKRFNPFYVLKHVGSIGLSISRKLEAGTYSPSPPATRAIPKPGGGERNVAVYEIPDAAVSHLFYKRLLDKNRHRFSAFSYAYRSDKNVHFAIQDIAVDLGYYARLFVAEFDFSDFFGSIQHPYLYKQLHENGFLVSPHEEAVIRSFLTASQSEVGIPQGTSISLFLANLVCWRLDKKLEAIGVKFARYADDSVIWTTDYGRISQSFDAIHEFSTDTGVPINAEKSKGINLLLRPGFKSEFVLTKQAFSFLGYKLAVGVTSIGDRAVAKIKKQLSFLLYENLIQPLLGAQLLGITIPTNNHDPAFLIAISQVRRYLYGNLTEDSLAAYLHGSSGKVSFKGVMSFYPLVNDVEQLKGLDGWLVGTIHRTLRKRARLLKAWHYNRDNQFPFNVAREDLVTVCATQIIGGKRLFKIPSFLRFFRALEKGIVEGGIEETSRNRQQSSG